MNFSALVVDKKDDVFNVEIKNITQMELPEGNILIKVKYSSVNYKDALASIPNGNIVKNYPFIPGIDLTGTVISSQASRFNEGDKVLVTGFDLGVTHFGGFSEYAKVPEDWVVPLPKDLSMKEAMAYGTAGFTAALSIHRLEENGLTPGKGPVLVTGATGGVGSLAVSMLAKKGYHVIASTGKVTEIDYLMKLGAKEVINRQELLPEKIRPLDSQKWAAAIDSVGGESLAFILSSIKYGGSVAVSGLTGGIKVPTTVFPFILRGVNLIGIDSVYCSMELRKLLWKKMADELKPVTLLNDISREVNLTELPYVLKDIIDGKNRGRVIVKI